MSSTNDAETLPTASLGDLPKGAKAVVCSLRPPACDEGLDLESRLLDLGFVEGARIEVLHEGPWGRDPIAVRVFDTVIAIRRADAKVIQVRT